MQNFISIPKPCNENWNTMTPQEQGRHCAQCNITVQDFSTMSNEEILQYLKHNTAHICARVREDQLQNTKPQFTYRLKKFLYAFAVCFLPFVTFTSMLLTNTKTIHAQAGHGSIDGKVVNHKGEPVPFASVAAFEGGVLKGQAKTNFKGNFVIKPLSKGNYTLKISSVGLRKLKVQDIQVASGKATTQNIKLRRKDRVIYKVGGIHYPPIVDPKKPGQQTISGQELRNMGGR